MAIAGSDTNDLAALAELAARLYAVEDPDDFGTAILNPVLELVPADSITYNEIDTRRRRTMFAVEPFDALDETDPAAFNRYVGQHPVVSYSRRTGDGRARTISDFQDRLHYHRTDLYATFFRPASVEHQMAITLAHAPSFVVGVALNRSAHDFTDRDRKVLNVARTLLVAGHQAVLAARENAVLLAAMDRALDEHQRGVLVVRPDGRLIAATPVANRLLRAHLGVRLARGQQLPHRLAALARRTPSQHPHVALVGQGARLYARLVASPERDRRTIVIDERADPDPAPLNATGITRREREILELIARGHSNAAIARQFQLSVRTVHKHLEHLYVKLDVHDRTAAATRWLAEEGVRDTTPPASSG